MKCASIDIGTNTLRLLVAEVKDGVLVPLRLERIITRLGGGYNTKGGISEVAMERTLEGLKAFSDIMTKYGVSNICAVATSVMRRAKNREKLLDMVKRNLGFDIDVITGEDEARLSLLGVLSILEDRRGRSLLIDIGGGSTEFIAINEGALVDTWSLEMGVVHLAERHMKGDLPTTSELEALESDIGDMLEGLKVAISESGVCLMDYSGEECERFIGTAGTVTALAAIDQNMLVYKPEKVNNYILTKDAIEGHYRTLSKMTFSERSGMPGLEKGRADLILPGAVIILKSMDLFGFDSISVSDSGMLEGILIDRNRSRFPVHLPVRCTQTGS